MHLGINNVDSEDLLQLQKKAGNKLKSSGPSNFCMICTCSFAICLGNLDKMSYISVEEFIPKVLHSVALAANYEHDTIIV